MKRIEFSKEEIEKIINLYVNKNIGMAKIGAMFNVSKSVISRIIKENNITHRNDNHKYIADYRKFQYIDTAEKAYWLGFIAADGCVYKRTDNNAGNFMFINIHQKDREHLEKFREFMNSNVNIIDHIQNQGFSNNTPMSKIILNSNDLVQDLIDKGIVPRKSLILKPPKIDEQFFLPFILGYFDGDGCLSLIEKTHQFELSFVGTKELLTWINDLLSISNHLGQKHITEKNNYFIKCGGTFKPYNILKILYDSVSVHLDRKYNKYKTLETVVLSRNTK